MKSKRKSGVAPVNRVPFPVRAATSESSDSGPNGLQLQAASSVAPTNAVQAAAPRASAAQMSHNPAPSSQPPQVRGASPRAPAGSTSLAQPSRALASGGSRQRGTSPTEKTGQAYLTQQTRVCSARQTENPGRTPLIRQTRARATSPTENIGRVQLTQQTRADVSRRVSLQSPASGQQRRSVPQAAVSCSQAQRSADSAQTAPIMPRQTSEDFNEDDPISSVSWGEVQPEPEVSSAGPLSVSTRVEFAALPHGSTKQIFGLVTLVASAESQYRAPMDLVCVLDVSGSMMGQKISLVQQAMRFVIDNAQAHHRVSVVAFNHEAARKLPLRRMDASGKSDARAATLRLCASGGTNIASGLHTGLKVMESRQHTNKVSAIMLLTDGQDGSARGHISSLLERAQRAGCGLYVFGFGQDHDAALLSQIAEQAMTPFTFVEDVEHIRQAFAGAVGGLESIVAQHIELRLQCRAVLTAVHTPFTVQRCSDNEVLVKIPDIFDQEKRDVLIELSVAAETRNGEEGAQHTELLEASVKYKEVRGGNTLQTPSVAMVVENCDELQPEAEPDEEVSAQRERFEVTQALKEASTHSDQGNYQAAQQVISKTEQSIRSKKKATTMSPVLLLELQDASSRMASRSSWEQGGRAEVKDAAQMFMMQRCTNVSSSSKCAVSKKSKAMFCSSSAQRAITKLEGQME